MSAWVKNITSVFRDGKLQKAQDLPSLVRLKLAAYVFAFTSAYQYKGVEVGYYEKILINTKLQRKIEDEYHIDDKKLSPEIRQELINLKERHVEDSLNFIKQKMHIKKMRLPRKVSKFLGREFILKSREEKREGVEPLQDFAGDVMQSQIKLTKKLKKISLDAGILGSDINRVRHKSF